MRSLFVIFVSCLCLLAAAQSVWAQTVLEHDIPEHHIIESHEVRQVALTVYPDNLAMVTEVRNVNVPKGLSEIRFHGVTDMIVPETAILQSFEGLRLEGNFNSDLMSRNALLQKAVGGKITIRRFNDATGESKIIEAELISATPDILGGEEAVFKTDDGLEALFCSGLGESVLFSNIQDGLNPVPMLSMLVKSEEAGTKEIILTYLTEGIGWEADYRMDVKADQKTGSLLGWLTLSNKTSKSFRDINLAVIAAEINRDFPPPESPYERVEFQHVNHPTCEESTVRKNRAGQTTKKLQQVNLQIQYAVAPQPVAQKISVRAAKSETLGDYKLYRAPQTVSLSAHQTKQIAFLLKPEVEFEKVYSRVIDLNRLFNGSYQIKPSEVFYEIDNRLDGNLAQALPKGTLRIMSETEAGQNLFTGEGPVSNLAVDLPFDVKIADSFIVMSQFGYETIEDEETFALRLTTDIHNATSEAIKAKLKFMNLAPSHIGTSNVQRDPEEALSSYYLDVAANSKQPLVLDVPLELYGEFTHAFPRYGRGSAVPGEYQDDLFTDAYRFKNTKNQNAILSRLIKFKGKKERKINFKATELSKTQLDSNTVEREEKFIFKNPNAMPLSFIFYYHSWGGKVELIESSMPHAKDDQSTMVDQYFSDDQSPARNNLFWDITVPANSDVVLTTTTRRSKK